MIRPPAPLTQIAQRWLLMSAKLLKNIVIKAVFLLAVFP